MLEGYPSKRTLKTAGQGPVSIEAPRALLPAETGGPFLPLSGGWAEPRIHPDATGPRASAPWRSLGRLGPTGFKPGADSLFKIK